MLFYFLTVCSVTAHFPFGSGARARGQRARTRRGEQLGPQHGEGDHDRRQAVQDRVPEPHVSEVLSRATHLETSAQACEFLSVFALISLLLFFFFCSFVSKMENRLQRRPRSTSMKDRQNSKAQSDRTSSMESECSPDSRLIAQVQQHSDAQTASEIKIKR